MLKVGYIVPLVLLLLGAASWAAWLSRLPALPVVSRRVPGTDRPAGAATEPAIDLRGTFTAGGGVPGKSTEAWPHFRGPQRTAICPDPLPLAKQPQNFPRLWMQTLGEGYAGPAIRNGRVYVLDYDQQLQADTLRCLSLEDGQEIWRRAYQVDIKRNHGMSRTVPAVTEQVVVTLGPKCHVLCVDATTGDFKWGKDLVRDYGTKVPPWYAGQCPLIDGGRVILAPAGPSALLVALDPLTGNPLWTTPNPHEWVMTHASILPLDFAGKRLYVYCGSGGVVAVDAENGAVLWECVDWKVAMATVPTPVDLGQGRLLFAGGYSAGAMLVQLQADGDKITHEILRKLPQDEFGAEQQTPIFYDNHIYGVIPGGGEMVCLDRDGNTLWRSGGGNRFGLGPYLIADGSLYALNDTGTMSVIEATPAAFRLQGRGPLLEKGHESWGLLALVGGKLLARDLTRMVCVDLRRP